MNSQAISNINNLGAVLTSHQQIGIVPVKRPTPKSHQVIIKVDAVSITKDDYSAFTGSSTSTILGTDIAGIVFAIGDKVKSFSIGDRVVAYTEHGFQNYVAADEKFTAKIPRKITLEDAVVLPSAFLKACFSLFDHSLQLSEPSTYTRSKQRRQRVLIWGAACDVGCSAIQLCKQAKYDVNAVINANQDGILGDDIKSAFYLLRTLGAHVVLLSTQTVAITELIKTKQINRLLLTSTVNGDCQAVLDKCTDDIVVKDVTQLEDDDQTTKHKKYLMDHFLSTMLPNFLANDSFVPAISPAIVGSNIRCIIKGFEYFPSTEEMQRVIVYMH